MTSFGRRGWLLCCLRGTWRRRRCQVPQRLLLGPLLAHRLDPGTQELSLHLFCYSLWTYQPWALIQTESCLLQLIFRSHRRDSWSLGWILRILLYRKFYLGSLYRISVILRKSRRCSLSSLLVALWGPHSNCLADKQKNFEISLGLMGIGNYFPNQHLRLPDLSPWGHR